jgi:voltage-gated potassium channel Kch
VQRFLSGLLRALRIKDLDTHLTAQERSKARIETVVFLGFFRDASSIIHEFEHEGDPQQVKEFLDKILVIDFNPTVMRELRHRGISCIYGDVAHADTLRHAGIEEAKLVVSSITDDILRGTSNLRMLRNIRATCPNAKVMLTTEHIPQALHFYEAGADFVYIPRLHSAPQIATVLKVGLEVGFDGARAAEIARLSVRREILA